MNNSPPAADLRHIGYVDLLLARSLTKGRCAKPLRNSMVAYAAGIAQAVDGRRYLFEPHAICQTIRVLEGLERRDITKGPFKYDDGPLAGLYRKHFFQASFMPQNILNEIARKREGAAIVFRKLTEHHGNKDYIGKPPGEADLALILQALFHDTIERRAKRRSNDPDGGLTGEYLIYAVTPKGNRYLYAAFHGEDDDQIVECIRGCLAEFPELARAAPLFRDVDERVTS